MAFQYQHRTYEPEVLKKLQKAELDILKDFAAVCDKYKLPYFLVFGSAIGAVRHKGFIPWDDDTDVAMLRKDYDRFLQVVDKELGDRYKILTPEIDNNYAGTVTHLQRKGTKFVAEFSKDLKCDMCIDLDIFPLDHVAMNPRMAKFQELTALFWGKLLFLWGTPHPVINLKGVKGAAAGWICAFAHYALRILHISPRFLFRRFKKAATRYNGKRAKYVTIFEGYWPLRKKIIKKDIFPLKKVLFEDMETYIPANNHEFLKSIYGDYMQLPPKENQINHIPYILQFENEPPIIMNGVMQRKNS